MTQPADSIAARYRYPDTDAERVLWHERGTPEPFTPYTPDAPDPTRDGLLRGFQLHRNQADEKTPDRMGLPGATQQQG